MLDETKEEQKQEEVKPNEDVSKVFGNENPAEETKADPKATEQKEPEKKETEQKQESAESASENKQSTKVYTQEEVDAMMAKARKKYMGKGDAINKEETAEVGEVAEEPTDETKVDEQRQDLATGITVDRLAQAELKASMAISGVNPSKVQRAVRLIDINNVIENGLYSEEKAKTEIETLLQEWPELKTQASDDSNGNGFYFGAPEQEEQSQEEKQKGMFSSIFGNK